MKAQKLFADGFILDQNIFDKGLVLRRRIRYSASLQKSFFRHRSFRLVIGVEIYNGLSSFNIVPYFFVQH